MNRLCIAALGGVLFACGACADKNSTGIEIINESALDRTGEMVGIDARTLPGEAWIVRDAQGRETASQLTADSMLIFRADVPAGASVTYTVEASDTAAVYPDIVTGRVYPERADDLAWENELQGFRAYGPATQRKGERAFGYDIFFKHRNERPVLEDLYGPETDPATWRKADSLRAIDPALAEKFIESISYHIDHGLGMDCYAVGPTLGAGVAAPLANDTLNFPWCYENVEIIDRGPLRFTARLDFAPRAIGTDSAVTEHRIISLDAGSRLNRCMVWYDGLTAPQTVIATGFPRRDDFPAITATDYIAYSDPTQGPDNGRALLGAVRPEGFDGNTETAGHLLATSTISPADTLDYYWGFAWNREEINTPEEWASYLQNFAETRRNPLKIKIQN